MDQSRYRVHIFAVVRVGFEAMAESFAGAAEAVLKDPATHDRLHALKGEDFEYAEDWEDKVVVDRLGEDGGLVDHTEVDVSGIDPSA